MLTPRDPDRTKFFLDAPVVRCSKDILHRKVTQLHCGPVADSGFRGLLFASVDLGANPATSHWALPLTKTSEFGGNFLRTMTTEHLIGGRGQKEETNDSKASTVTVTSPAMTLRVNVQGRSWHGRRTDGRSFDASPSHIPDARCGR